MIRILHVVSSLNINSGVMSVIMNYYKEIDRKAIQFDFLYFEKVDKNFEDEINELGGKTYFIEYPTFKYNDQVALNSFFRIHNDFLAVHCHPIWASFVVSLAARKNGINHIIQHSHSTEFGESTKSIIRNALLMKLKRLFITDYVACSPEAANLFGRKVVKHKGYFLLTNAIKLDQYSYDKRLRIEFRKEFGVSDNTFLIGNVGRLCQQKNQLYLIEVFHSLINNCSTNNYTLMIVGDGPLKNDLEQAVVDYGITDKVIFTGKRNDMRAVLSSFDMFLLPSLFEGAPMAAIEAVASGLPCFISDTITKSIQFDKVKYLPIQGSPEIWVQSIIEDSKLNLNRELIDSYFASKFDITITAKQLVDYYLSFLEV